MNKYAKDIRFKPHVDLRVAGLGFESTASIAKETLSDYASVLHNHPTLLVALASYVTALDKGFDDFLPEELAVSVNHLRNELKKVSDKLSAGYATTIQCVIDEYQLFAARLAA